MAMISLRQLLDHAAEHGLRRAGLQRQQPEQIQAIMRRRRRRPMRRSSMQASGGLRKYAGEPFLRKMVEAVVEMYPDIPIVLHQDHGASPAVCMQAIRPASPA